MTYAIRSALADLLRWVAGWVDPEPVKVGGGGLVTTEASILAQRLEDALPELEDGRETHVIWRDWLLKDPENAKVNPHAGTAEFHAGMVDVYDVRIGAVRDAAAYLRTLE